MRIDSIMTNDVAVCQPDTNLAEVGAKMWAMDCGIVPVVDSWGTMIGVVTDRDICMALTTRNIAASSLKARDVMTGRVESVSPEDEVFEVLQTMRDHRIRRVPVVRDDGRLVGIVSTCDLLRAVGPVPGPTFEADLLETLHAISEPQRVPRDPFVATM